MHVPNALHVVVHSVHALNTSCTSTSPIGLVLVHEQRHQQSKYLYDYKYLDCWYRETQGGGQHPRRWRRTMLLRIRSIVLLLPLELLVLAYWELVGVPVLTMGSASIGVCCLVGSTGYGV